DWPGILIFRWAPAAKGGSVPPSAAVRVMLRIIGVSTRVSLTVRVNWATAGLVYVIGGSARGADSLRHQAVELVALVVGQGRLAQCAQASGRIGLAQQLAGRQAEPLVFAAAPLVRIAIAF